ncbi:unnamed protein product [Caenorhabditis bovis]|uniref:Uncharacterized protein n=1 Tax=Caenorhabditis bovis TaxID=2654633 RepID=A0A8S1EMZ5_9PELO|nr:unnamed protein product [Caenorhabditis bovis]
MFKDFRMGDDEANEQPQSEQVRDILLLPKATSEDVHESAADQIASVVDFIHVKLAEYIEVIQQNCRAVFVVNYVQNGFIAAEFCGEIAKLLNVLKVKSYSALCETLESLKNDEEMKPSVDALNDSIKAWNSFLKEIDDDLDKTIGPCNNSTTEPTDDGVFGLQSKTISYYLRCSPYDCILMVVVRSFNKTEVNDYILELYKRIDQLRKLGCDVFLLTKGPPIGARGGGYVKLIGVPFRKLYDAEEAEKELKAHRKSAEKHASWEPLCRVVEMSLVDENRPASSQGAPDEPVDFISQKGGTVLVAKTGEVLFKHIEDDKNETLPDVEEIVKIVETCKNSRPKSAQPKSSANLAKVESEISVANEKKTDEKKSCCVIC